MRVTLLAAILIVTAADAHGQNLNEVLSFLLTNRSIPTDDFVRDAEAADTTRATIARFLQIELGTVPIASSASGFTYRLNRSLGAVERTSDSFGPFFVNRSLTLGARQVALSLAHRATTFGALDGRPLDDGTLVATASQLAGEGTPFDVETLTLHVHTRSTLLSANVGLTDRLDVGMTVPFVRISVSGERVDTYRGARSLQAAASSAVAGVSDILVRGKYNAFRDGGTGVSVGADARLPTGDADNLLGGGELTVGPRVIGSIESDRVAVHADVGFVVGGAASELDFGAAVTFVGTPRLTLVGEIGGRRLGSLGRLVDAVQPHPTLVGVQTLRLTSTDQAMHRMALTAGFKWNVFSTWLLSGHISRPLTNSGLTGGWVPTVTLDYLLER
jgi:hypothetical protein